MLMLIHGIKNSEIQFSLTVW